MGDKDKTTGYRREAIGDRKRRPIAHSLLPIVSGLFRLFRMVFPVGDDKSKNSHHYYRCKDDKHACHLFALLRWNDIKTYSKRYYSNCKDKYHYRDIHFIRKHIAENTGSDGIFGNIDKHLACFFSSVFMLHDSNYIIKREAIGDA